MKKKGKKLAPYEEKAYQSILVIHLIVFSIHSIIKKGERCTFEKLVEECFYLFPKAFSFVRHPKWPDSLKLDRQLRTLREKGFITGSPRTSFLLTKFGEKIAENTKEILKKGKIRKSATFKIFRDSDVNLINSLKTSGVFQKFLRNKKDFSITEMELRNILHCTLETPSRIVKQNLIYTKNLTREFNEKKLFEFLEVCYRRFK